MKPLANPRRAARQVEAPDPHALAAGEALGLLAVGVESPDPLAEGLDIVLREPLDVVGLEARSFQRELHPGEMQGRRVWEHVALGEGSGLGVAVAHPRDAVVEQPSAAVQEARELGGVDVDLTGADVLDHADRSDRVEALAGQIPVVGDADLHAILETPGGDTLPRQFGLGGGEGDADGANPVV